MAVYTIVDDDAIRGFLAGYDLGEVTAFKGIAEGVENTNYLLQTEQGSFIATLYEKRVKEADLPFFLGLLDHLADRGVPCPRPVHGRDGDALRRLLGRPAAIVTFLKGVSIHHPGPAHCRAVGAALAGLHLASHGFAMRRPNDLSISGWAELLAASRSRADTLEPGLAAFLEAAFRTLTGNWPEALPEGVIHADLFPDNVFFLGEGLSGLIDFYFACNDALAYDLAISLNAWCFDERGALDRSRAAALFAGYEEVRPLSRDERVAFPTLARGAALRFALTRLYDWLHHVEGAFVQPKDPLEFVRKLEFHQGISDIGDYGYRLAAAQGS